MKRETLRELFLDELTEIAPEIERDSLRDSDNIQRTFDLDSMDFLNLLTALHQRLDVDIPDKDAAKLLTVNSALDYLQEIVPN